MNPLLTILLLTVGAAADDLPTGPMPRRVYPDGTVMYVSKTDGQRHQDGWFPCKNEPNCQWFLWRSGNCLGAFDPVSGWYRSWDGVKGDWGQFGESPVPIPAMLKGNVGKNFGVIPVPPKSYPDYSIDGHTASRGDVIQEISGDGLVDDTTKRRITVIGSDLALRHGVLDQVRSLVGDKALVKDYPPDHWAVSGVGMPRAGNPTVVVQDPPDTKGRGVVKHVQNDASNIVGALRRVDPAFDETKTPDLRKPPLAEDSNTWTLVVGAVVLYSLIREKQR